MTHRIPARLHTLRSLAALVLGTAILLAGLALARDLTWLGADFRR